MKSITFKANLQIESHVMIGPITNQRSVSIPHPDGCSGPNECRKQTLKYHLGCSVVYHGDTFTLNGQKAIDFKNNHATGHAAQFIVIKEVFI